MIIAIDFDGTCVEHKYPKVGADINSVPTLLNLVEQGHQLILWTMRSGKELQDAVDWFSNRGITLFGINNNPEQHEWTSSPKAYAQLYIDDAALGCPLTIDQFATRPYVDWSKVEELLKSAGILQQT